MAVLEAGPRAQAPQELANVTVRKGPSTGIPINNQQVTMRRKVNCTRCDAGRSARGATTRGGKGR
eukprot:12298991-Alexandrium_andersonii.AAC.1